MSVLVFLGQVFVVWWAINWVAHRGDPTVNAFRHTCRQIRTCVAWPAQRRRERARRAAEAAWTDWVAQAAWWSHERGRHSVGSAAWETANDMITFLHSTRPTPPRS